MVKAINSMREKDEAKLLKNIEVVLNDNSLLLHGKAAMRENVNPAYDISVLNTSISAEKVMKMLKNAKNYADKNPGSGAIRMLFYGLSGTGKTEFAKVIAQAAGLKIYSIGEKVHRERYRSSVTEDRVNQLQLSHLLLKSNKLSLLFP